MTNTPRNYNHISHTHCWEQGGHPPCGIPMEKHTQCCLCDLKVPTPRTWEETFQDEFRLDCDWADFNKVSSKAPFRDRLTAFISTIEDEAVRRTLDNVKLGLKAKNVRHVMEFLDSLTQR